MSQLKKTLVGSFLVAAGLLVVACSNDDMPEGSQPSSHPSECRVTMSLTRASADSFATAGIREVRFFAYVKQNKRDSLVRDTTLNIGCGVFSVGLPLGESIRAFIVANAQGIEKTDKLDSVSLTLDPSKEADIWLSNVASFATDKTVSEVSFNMRRIISRAVFQPEETPASIAGSGNFDNIEVTFSNIASSYRVSGDSAVALTSVALTANSGNNYTVSVNSFPTRADIDATAGFSLLFRKGTEEVNRTPAVIDAGFNYTASHIYHVVVPVTDNTFVKTAWTRGSNIVIPFRIADTLFY
jgi:hypothetical protein